MKNYLIGGLSAAQKSQLSSAGCIASELSIGTDELVLVEEQRLQEVMGILAATVVEERDSPYEGIARLILDWKDGNRAGLDEQHARWRRMYIDACAKRLDLLIKETTREVVEHRKAIETAQADLVCALRLSRLERRDSASGNPLVDREAFGKEFDSLVELPKVRHVTVENGAVSVYTDPLHCSPGNGKRYNLGSYLIKLFLGGGGDCVRWFNVDRSGMAATERQAPNVLASGRSLLSYGREIFPELVADFQLTIATQLAIDLIEQSNGEEPVDALLSGWPEA